MEQRWRTQSRCGERFIRGTMENGQRIGLLIGGSAGTVIPGRLHPRIRADSVVQRSRADRLILSLLLLRGHHQRLLSNVSQICWGTMLRPCLPHKQVAMQLWM